MVHAMVKAVAICLDTTSQPPTGQRPAHSRSQPCSGTRTIGAAHSSRTTTIDVLTDLPEDNVHTIVFMLKNCRRCQVARAD
eukprot:713210-Amphidinium_carterae.1